jgi:hypothetical protein
MNPQYEIEVFEEQVIFWGPISLSDFLHHVQFFSEKGYSLVNHGTENSTLVMKKPEKQENPK